MHKKNISKDRQKYLRKIAIKKAAIILTQLGIVIAFIAIWEICANKEIIDSFITSQPSKIWETLINLSENQLLMHLWVTCEETLIGFGLGVAIGILVAIILWWSDFLSKVSEPFLVVLNSLPKVALRTNNNNMGWSRKRSNNNNGASNFTYCNNNGNTKWLPRNRQRKNKDGTNV